jgi:hypothetical protein
MSPPCTPAPSHFRTLQLHTCKANTVFSKPQAVVLAQYLVLTSIPAVVVRQALVIQNIQTYKGKACYTPCLNRPSHLCSACLVAKGNYQSQCWCSQRIEQHDLCEQPRHNGVQCSPVHQWSLPVKSLPHTSTCCFTHEPLQIMELPQRRTDLWRVAV